VHVVVEGVVESFQNVAFVDKGNYDFIVLFKPLKHVETHLEGWLVVFSLWVWVSCIFFASNFDEDSGELQGVVEDVILDQ